jgi:hypothetical protein
METWRGNKSGGGGEYRRITRKGDVSYEQYVVEKIPSALSNDRTTAKYLRFEADHGLTRNVVHRRYYAITAWGHEMEITTVHEGTEKKDGCLEQERAVRGSSLQQTSTEDDIWKGICYPPSFLFPTHLLAILLREQS